MDPVRPWPAPPPLGLDHMRGMGTAVKAFAAGFAAKTPWPPPLLLADGTPDHDMLDAMAEVDALTPACPPISPGIRNQMGPWPAPPEPWPDDDEPPIPLPSHKDLGLR